MCQIVLRELAIDDTQLVLNQYVRKRAVISYLDVFRFNCQQHTFREVSGNIIASSRCVGGTYTALE